MLLSPLAPDLAHLLIQERLQSAAGAVLAAQARAANRAINRAADGSTSRPGARSKTLGAAGATRRVAQRGTARLARSARQLQNGISTPLALALRNLALRIDPSLGAEAALVAGAGALPKRGDHSSASAHAAADAR